MNTAASPIPTVPAPGADAALPVTVVIPAFNRAATLPRALASAFGQQPRPAAEVIVVDDGSSDDTAAVAERLGARVVRHDANRGLCAARNSGLEAATQPWIAFLDSDDEWLAHHLATLWEIKGEDHVLASGTALCRGDDPLHDRLHGPARTGVQVLESPAPLVFPDNSVVVSAALVRADLVREVGGFRPFYGVEDLDLWLRLLERGTGVVTSDVTIIYHVHAAQMSGDVAAMQEGHAEVARQHADKPWWSEGLLERWLAKAAWNNLRTAVRRGRPGEAVRLAAWIARRPVRVAGVVSSAAARARLRRRLRRVKERP